MPAEKNNNFYKENMKQLTRQSKENHNDVQKVNTRVDESYHQMADSYNNLINQISTLSSNINSLDTKLNNNSNNKFQNISLIISSSVSAISVISILVAVIAMVIKIK